MNLPNHSEQYGTCQWCDKVCCRVYAKLTDHVLQYICAACYQLPERNCYGAFVPQSYYMDESVGSVFWLMDGDLFSANVNLDETIDWDNLVEPEFGRLDGDLEAYLLNIRDWLRTRPEPFRSVFENRSA